MSQVTMRLVTIKGDRYYDNHEKLVVLVDGEEVGRGSYGGEPEDNTRWRHYSWVEDTIEKMAKALGAEVISEEVEEEW